MVMQRTRLAPALLAASCLLAACDKLTEPPAPRAGTGLPAVPMATPDPSVPPAPSVLSQATTATAKDAASGRATGTLTPAQESTAMPMPGQVNNHSSTALDPAKRAASAP